MADMGLRVLHVLWLYHRDNWIWWEDHAVAGPV